MADQKLPKGFVPDADQKLPAGFVADASPTQATPLPTMQAAPEETMGQKVKGWFNEPMAGFSEKSPKQAMKEVGEGLGVAVPAAMTMMNPGAMVKGMVGAAGGAELGSRGGRAIGSLFPGKSGGNIGAEVGGVAGSLAGGLGLGGMDLRGGLKGVLGRIMGAGEEAAPVGIGKVGSAAQEAGYQPPVLKIPEPGPATMKVTPEQIPGPDTAGKGNLLTPLAKRGVEGTGEELARRGRTVLYEPLGADIPTKAPKMKMTFPEGQGGHAGGSVSSEEELARAGKNYIVKPSGDVTYHGKSFAPEEAGRGQAHVTVLPNGEFRVNAGQLSDAMRKGLSRAVSAQ